MELQQPLHTDSPRFSAIDWLNPALSLGLIVVGLMDGEAFPLIAGMALLVFVWFTRHFKYHIYSDALVIMYGTPRQKVVQLDHVTEIRNLQFGMRRDSIFVRLVTGRGLIIRPLDPEQFIQQLQMACDQLNRTETPPMN